MSDPIIPLTDGGLPMMSGPPPILLPSEAAEAVEALEAAARQGDDEALRAVAANQSTFVDAWARLGETAYRRGQDVEAFAFFRTGYHRGLDNLRRNGWRGLGYVPWSHEPNRGVLRAIRGLMLASAALGEAEEARRCRQLLLDSDPSDPLSVGALRDEDFEGRIPL